MKIESYIWSDGLASSPVFMQEITAAESGGSTITARLAVSLPLSAALNALALELTADPASSGVYSFSYDPESNRVTLACGGVPSVAFSFGGQLARGLGFGGSLSGALSYTAASPPRLAAPLLGVDVEVSTPRADQELREFRHGRHSALFFSNSTSFRCVLTFERSKCPGLVDGFGLAGRVRVWTGGALSGYSDTNITGYLDGFIYSVGSFMFLDRVEDLMSVEVFISKGHA